MRGRFALRAVGLLAVGALVLHQATYRLTEATGGLAGGHSHSYLPLLAALAIVLLGLSCAHFARALWSATHGHHDEPEHPSFPVLWLVMAAAMLSVFGLQEWIESAVAPGHPAGPMHVLQHVGWVGLALALLLGGTAAALLRGSRAAIVLLAKRHASLRRPRPSSGRGFSLPSPVLRRLDVLACHRAGRAPPIASF